MRELHGAPRPDPRGAPPKPNQAELLLYFRLLLLYLAPDSGRANSLMSLLMGAHCFYCQGRQGALAFPLLGFHAALLRGWGDKMSKCQPLVWRVVLMAAELNLNPPSPFRKKPNKQNVN